MGWNTSLMIMNDALGSLEKDTEFNKKLHSAILRMGGAPNTPIEVDIGNSLRSCVVIESHSSENCIPILVGANYGWPVRGVHVRWSSADPEKRLLEALANKHGFELVKKDKKNG